MLLRLATRTSPKVVATAFGIALCVMFLSGGMALLDGLRVSVDGVADRFDEGPLLAYASLPLEDARVPPDVVAGLTGPHALVRTARVIVNANGTSLGTAVAASVSNGTILRASLSGLGDGEVWIGEATLMAADGAGVVLRPRDPLDLWASNGTAALAYERVHPSSPLPDGWLWVTPATSEALDPGGAPSFLLLPEDSPDVRFLASRGLTVVPATAAVEFLRRGVDDLAGALWGLVLAAGAVVAVLTFALMALEVRYREREMRTMRQIGAPPAFLVRLVLLQSAYVATFGALLGLALGHVVANAVTSFAPLAGLATFALPQPTLAGILVPVAVALVAGVLGGALPAARSARVPIAQGVAARS